MCRWSGSGYVKCTYEYRQAHPKLCEECKNNLDEIVDKIMEKDRPEGQTQIGGI